MLWKEVEFPASPGEKPPLAAYKLSGDPRNVRLIYVHYDGGLRATVIVSEPRKDGYSRCEGLRHEDLILYLEEVGVSERPPAPVPEFKR